MSADDRMRRHKKLGEYLGEEAKTKMVGRAKRPPPRLAGLQLQHCETAEGHLLNCQACSNAVIESDDMSSGMICMRRLTHFLNECAMA